MGYQSQQDVSNHQGDIYNTVDVCYILDGEKMRVIANVTCHQCPKVSSNEISKLPGLLLLGRQPFSLCFEIERLL